MPASVRLKRQEWDVEGASDLPRLPEAVLRSRQPPLEEAVEPGLQAELGGSQSKQPEPVWPRAIHLEGDGLIHCLMKRDESVSTI